MGILINPNYAKAILARLPADMALPDLISINTIDELETLRAVLGWYVQTGELPVIKKTVKSTFPMEYKGWRIEIEMGREFKNVRGSVKGKRGYVATRLSDGKKHEYPPTYDISPSLSGVKAVVDVEESAGK